MNLGLVLKSGSCAFLELDSESGFSSEECSSAVLELVSESGFSSEDRSMVLVPWASLMPLCVAV